MARKFETLRAAMPPEHQARAEERATAMLAELPLHELRQARRLSQQTLAKALGATQSSVSKIERRTDMYLSTLREYIEAMGGELEIRARFPDGEVRIRQLGAIGEPGEGTAAEPATDSGTRAATVNARG